MTAAPSFLRAKSLGWRIFFASIVLTPLLLSFSAFMLERAFRASLYSAEQESLLAHTYSMMAVAEPEQGFLQLPENLTDSRFNDPNSGLYAQVVDDEFGPVWESISLSISPLATLVPFIKVETGSLAFNVEDIKNKTFFISRFNTVWEIEGQDREYQFTVIHAQDQLEQEVRSYRKILLGWLGGLALLMIVLQTLIIRWGLLPLKRLAHDIKQLETGAIDCLDKNYPGEIVPVTENINFLLQSEKNQRSRYKNTLSDLAHSLKTPLSVIRSLMEKRQQHKDPTHQNRDVLIDEQIERMSNIITHQLNRANASKALYLSKVHIHQLFCRVADALQKIYREKHIAFTIHGDTQLHYAAQEDDIMEVFGNVLENAFKYCRSKVEVRLTVSSKDIRIEIADDGAGVPQTLRGEILKRGARIDTSTPGQGIGLTVAVDIISSYNGGIKISESSFGGANFIITLPHAITAPNTTSPGSEHVDKSETNHS